MLILKERWDEIDRDSAVVRPRCRPARVRARLHPRRKGPLALLDDLLELLGVRLGVSGDNHRLLGDGVLAISQA